MLAQSHSFLQLPDDHGHSVWPLPGAQGGEASGGPRTQPGSPPVHRHSQGGSHVEE